MIIFVDGYQNVGKSEMVDNCKYKHNRFPFNQYLDELKLDLNNYQLGKDLGMVFMSNFIKDNVILDRGPLSTVFYSLKENRYGDKTVEMMIRFLEQIKPYKNCRFVWVNKINDNDQLPRIHEDGFDYLDDDHDNKKEETFVFMLKLLDYVGIDVHIFENDFSVKLKQNYHRFNNFLEGLINEHHRNKN